MVTAARPDRLARRRARLAWLLILPLLTSLAAANQMCTTFFGAGWRMAEFHDGWGWGMSAFGNVRSDTRFWVHINDQPANCWNP